MERKEEAMNDRVYEVIAEIIATIGVATLATCWNALIIKLAGGWVLGVHITWPLAFKAGAVISLLGNTLSLLPLKD